MSEEVKVFENNEFGSIRTIIKDGNPWFVVKDVCDALDLGNVTRASDGLDEDERGLLTVNTLGGEQDMLVISESGLYSLVLRSRKTEARDFKRWITHEVLPSIRKHGVYATEDFIQKSISDPDWAISVLQTLKFEKEQKELALRQRDEAVRTKAMINGRQLATAMGRNGGYVKDRNRWKKDAESKAEEISVLKEDIDDLQTRLGESTTYKTVKAIPWLDDYFSELTHGAYTAIGMRLKKISGDLGLDVVRIEDSRYGTICTYHVSAIEELRRILDDDQNYLGTYR